MKAVFLDRDGTIAYDVPYCSRPEDFVLMPGAAEAIARLNKAGFMVVVITNQSGIARGLFTAEILEQIHRKMRITVAEAGGEIERVYYCPHMPDSGCSCRKPGVSLFIEAEHELGIEMQKSFVIGDQLADMIAGNRCGCRTVLVWSKDTEADVFMKSHVDFTCNSILKGAKWIAKR